jgi:hypothetical protein
MPYHFNYFDILRNRVFALEDRSKRSLADLFAELKVENLVWESYLLAIDIYRYKSRNLLRRHFDYNFIKLY